MALIVSWLCSSCRSCTIATAGSAGEGAMSRRGTFAGASTGDGVSAGCRRKAGPGCVRPNRDVVRAGNWVRCGETSRLAAASSSFSPDGDPGRLTDETGSSASTRWGLSRGVLLTGRMSLPDRPTAFGRLAAWTRAP